MTEYDLIISAVDTYRAACDAARRELEKSKSDASIVYQMRLDNAHAIYVNALVMARDDVMTKAYLINRPETD